MRIAFRDALSRRILDNPLVVLLAGDVGYRVLEPLRDDLGDRFINTGVAEQNMIGVAAALASDGMEPWVYSIAPFIYARPFEQIRNDVCLHRAPVRLVANGGGFAYGSMGATHHAIEDYGVMCSLNGMHCIVPAFDPDIADIVSIMGSANGPSYLRLGLDEAPAGFDVPRYSPWRLLHKGNSARTVVAIGPLAGAMLRAVEDLPADDQPDVWALCELPVSASPPPDAFLQNVEAGALWVVEEHVPNGSAGHMLLAWLAEHDVWPQAYRHFTAGYRSGRYGSQNWHRSENGLDAASLRRALLEM